MEKIDFSAKFAWKLSFCKNRGKFELTQCFYVSINSIRGIKICILDLKPLFSPSLVSLLPSQTDGTENGQFLLPESTSYETD